MATDGKRNRKRDRFLRPFSGIVHSISKEPHIASTPAILDVQPHSTTDSIANTTPNPNSHLPETSLSVKASKSFTKGKSFEQDVAALYVSFALQENVELKKAFKLIITLRNNDENDQLVDVLGKCAQFAVQLASSSERESRRAEVTQAITDLERIMERMRGAQLAGDTECLKASSFSVDELITKIKPASPGAREGLNRAIDVTIGTTISVLSIVESASSIIPVPLVQPIVAQVVTMLQAISQTRSNYNDMREIATIAGEFAVSCAIFCSESPEGPSAEFKRSLDRFTKKLEGIARECIERSQIGLFSRYFQRNVHANDLQSIKTRLNSSIEIFQNETEVNIKLDTEALKRNLDFASLNTLPSHPRYERSEYLENSRDDVIEYVSRWISDAPELVLWIHGPAGMGKSTVAQQLIYLLQQEDRLAGGVLLTLVAQEHPAEIIRMIAKQLGEKHPQAITEVAEAARKLNSVHDCLRDYLTAYIINPIRQLKYPYQLIILIDGLDEWRNLEPFIQELAHIPSPSPVKFILTSRFNHTIDRVLSKASVHKYSLPSVPQPVMERYFHLHFASDEIDWQGRRPDEHKIRQLAILADGLLVWAATVRSLVLNKFDQRHPHEILDDIITSEVKVVSKGGRQLEYLYRNALLALFPLDIHGALRDFLGAILVLQEALPLSDFAHLMRNHISERAAKEIHRSLAALRIRDDPESEIVSPAIGSYHSSFLEFIQSGFTAIGEGEPSNQSTVSRDAQLKLGQACINVTFRDFLPSFKGQTCTYSELSILECYSVKFWPLHLSNGTERTSREADSALANVSSTALRRWATLFLRISHVSRRPIDEGREINIPTTSELFSELFFLVESRSPATPLSSLHFLELSVRRQPQNVLTWISLGIYHHWVYRRLRDGHNLEEAIGVFRHALKLISEGLSGDEPTLMTTGFIFEDNDSDADISTIPNFGRKNKVLMCLADALEARFERIGTLSDLDEAIVLHREALDLYLASHPHRPFQSLNNFARALQARFRQRGELSDIDEAVRVLQEALQLRSPPHPDFWLLIGNLAYVLQIRFEGQGDLADLDEAVSIHRRVLDCSNSAPQPDRSSTLLHLGNALQTRFQHLDIIGDLEEAISVLKEALHLRSPSHVDRSGPLNSLGLALRTHFGECSGALIELDEAISLFREALHLRPKPHPERSGTLNNLGGALRIRFEQIDNLVDLDEAISIHKEALELCPVPHPCRSHSLSNLAHDLRTRFEKFGALTDLNESIYLYREALQFRPAPHPDRPWTLRNLAKVLELRFVQLNSSADLEEAISLHREDLELRPMPNGERWRSLVCLGMCLRTRYKLEGAVTDREEALSMDREAIDICTPPQTHYLGVVRCLIADLVLQFRNKREMETVCELIRLFQQIVDAPSADKKDQSWALEGLTVALRERDQFQAESSRDAEEAQKLEES